MNLRLPKVTTGQWRNEYSFRSRYFELGPNQALHYVDEGEGPPVVMVHGNPTWSFMYRRLIKNLKGYRRLALDHLGMGLSGRPGRDYSFSLKDRLSDFSRWLEYLKLTQPVHLIVHDWGGPIGLGWAGQHPEQVASLTIMNTGLRQPKGFTMPTKLAIFKYFNFLGRLLATELNLFLAGTIRFGTIRPMPPEIQSGFMAPYLVAAHRESLSRFVADIPLNSKHPSRQTLVNIDHNFERLADKPALLIWGLKDFVFTKVFLEDFRSRLPKAKILALPRAGHCLLEDEPEIILSSLNSFLKNSSQPTTSFG
jgi:haloalkane dehalogenase